MSTANLSLLMAALNSLALSSPLGSPHWHANRVLGIRRGQIPAIWECQQRRTSNPLRCLLPILCTRRPDPAAIIMEMFLGREGPNC